MIFSKFPTLTLTFLLSTSLLILNLEANHTRLSRADYITRYRHIALDHQQRYGIPASITMAQGILESDNGHSILARASNNHFGIKCKSYWKGRTYYYTDDAPDECFRAYDTVEESYEDHAIFLESSPRYDSLFHFAPTDYRSWARALKGAGYATAPDYTQKLIKLIEENKLHELDLVAAGSTPQTTTKKGETKLIDPNSNSVGTMSHHGYKLHKEGAKFYIVTRKGDTIKEIAQKFNISKSRLRKLNKLNKLNRDEEPTIGSQIFVE